MKKIFSLISIFLLTSFVVVAEMPVEKELTFLDSFVMYYKVTNAELTNDIVTAYLHDWEFETYTKYKDDEFEWNDQLKSYKDQLSKMVADTSENSVFKTYTAINFDNYDFDKSGFPVKLNQGIYFTYDSNQQEFYSALPSVYLFFTNLDQYKMLPMEKDIAGSFVKSRKGASGSVNRQITLLVHYTLVNGNSSEYKKIKTSYNMKDKMLVVGNVSSIDVYDKKEKIGELVIQK